MSKNNKIELNGFLGSDPKTVSKGDKNFVILNVATTDSYPSVNEKTGEVTWKDKDTVWHDVLVFRPTTIQYTKDLKKGDKVEIGGSISYRIFKDAEGKNRKQATMIATFIDKIAYNKQENLLLNNVDKIIDEEITA